MNHAFEIIPLTIEARGEVIQSNVDEVRELVRAALENINRDLNTDEEFGQAELDVKALKGAEETFTSAKEKALKDAEALHLLFSAIDATVEEIRKPRLELEKLIAKRKEEIKTELQAEYFAKIKCAAHVRRKAYLTNMADAVKGKRTVETMRKALESAVTVANGNIDLCREKLEAHVRECGEASLPDRDDLETMAPAFLEAELRRRVEANKAAEERKRLEAEAAKAKAEAQAAIREAEAARQPAKPAPLPTPPKIGSIPTGSKSEAPVESNVLPFQADPVATPAEISDVEEWKQFSATVYAAFALIKEHRERLKYSANIDRALAFGQGINPLWKSINAKEVAR